MLENKQDATSAGYAVGYESLTQFNREYKRLFGSIGTKIATLQALAGF